MLVANSRAEISQQILSEQETSMIALNIYKYDHIQITIEVVLLQPEERKPNTETEQEKP